MATMMMLDETHDPALRSWVATANGHSEFPIQNLPLGIFSISDDKPRPCIAIGDMIFDLQGARTANLFLGEAADAITAGESTLNSLLALGPKHRRALRKRLSEILAEGSSNKAKAQEHLFSISDVTMHLPVSVGDYTDFYVGIHHATHVGKLFRPENPLLPNYKYIPIGYHGRASSVIASGVDIRRPKGQIKGSTDEVPTLGPSRRLDFELEIGVWIGPGNALGENITLADAPDHIAGFCLLNDWSARDIQAWEYQPLGPFLAKSFATTVSPWIVTQEALEPYRIPRPLRIQSDPEPLSYLEDDNDRKRGAFDIDLTVLLTTAKMRHQNLPPSRLSVSNSRYMYWTVGQMVTHHSINGCNLRPGDLLGTGTISGPTPDSRGSLLELSDAGKQPITLSNGEQRSFLEDGDEVILQAHCKREGYVTIGFGDCRATILQASE